MGWDDSDQKVLKEAIERALPILQEMADNLNRFADAVVSINAQIAEMNNKEKTDDE